MDWANHLREMSNNQENRVVWGLEEAASHIDTLRNALQQYADKNNWGYYDESGCPKGHGHYADACFLGTEIAEKALTPNAVLTGAGHETTGNGAPYHRVRLKT